MGTAGTASRRFEVPGPGAQDYQREADRILLGRYAPPAVLVDENFEILLFRGRTSAFLEAPSGEPTTNVLKMAREGMFLDLRNALTEAKQHNRTTRRDGVSLRADGRVAMISIEVVPVRPNRGCNSYLILFSDEPPQASSVAAANPTVEATPVTAEDAATEVSQLRQELGATREYLQSLIEQQDAANEELRSANEEILSSNEELQSTNEELETAKEELQSANEELSTVNEQLQRRNVELDQVNNDLSNLLGSINIPVVMVSGDLRLRRFTPAARKVMGLLPTDIGRPITDIRPAHLIEDLEAVITEVIERVQPHEREVRDSDSLYFKLRVHPYRTADQKIDGAVLVLVDVDQLRRQQEEEKRQAAQPLQQAALIELSHDAVILRGADDSITSWNAGAQEIYGWTAGEAIGQSIDTLFQTHPDDLRELQAGLRVAGRWEGEMRQRRKDGTPAVVQSREVLVRDEMGESSAVLAITRDISELRAMMDALRKADRRKDEFLAVLAHELRNPLGPIRNAIEIMRLGAKDPDMVANARDVLDRQVRQMTGIIEDLIDLTRIVEGKIDLKMRTVALNSIVPTAVETCRSIIERYGHQLTVTIPTETYYVNVDAIRISQIIVNLLNNAAKYTDAGGKIWLDVSVEDAGEGGGDGPSHVGARNAAIHVRDTGRGIPAELLPSLFTIFTQGERCNEQVGGLGVGLALVRSLAQLHGGSVEARSAGAGQGSEFIVRLPLVDRPMEPQEPERLHVAPPVRPAAPSGTRILIVDDSTDQAESLGRLLTILGHSIRTTSTGEEGIEIIKQFRPHVALIDIGLPGINGYELARRIRETASVRDTVLVAQTGWGQEEDRRRSSEAGFDHHLVKPLEMADLTEILNTLERRD
jgi:two-component system CheB/CheR fusion protein